MSDSKNLPRFNGESVNKGTVVGLESKYTRLHRRINELSDELHTYRMYDRENKKRIATLEYERDKYEIACHDLKRLLRAALRENPQWHTAASMEAERLLGAAGEG